MKYPNYVARRKIWSFLLSVTWPWAWHDDIIFRVTGLQKFETDQSNAKFSQITWLLHDDVIFRVTGLQKFETDQSNAKFSQITWLLHLSNAPPKKRQ